MADESRATVYKALVATVQLGDSCACIPFLVLLTIVDDVILGIDFLCAAPHCIVDLTTPSGETLPWPGEPKASKPRPKGGHPT
ncbi:hypothetical protein ACLKA7_005000 [Drosophila subpalustris]